MRRTDKAEIQSVLQLDGPQRFRHFIKRAADEECVWGLWDDGWALSAQDDGTQVLPLWPASEYANLAREGEWASYTPKTIGIYKLLEDLLPSLEEDGIHIGVFPTPEGKSVIPTTNELREVLSIELRRYE